MNSCRMERGDVSAVANATIGTVGRTPGPWHSPIGAANHAVLGPLFLKLNVLLKVKARHALTAERDQLAPRWH
jgi:hypothetical protein